MEERLITETDCCVCGHELAPTGEDECEVVGAVLRGKAEVCPSEDNPGRNVCVIENIKFLRMVCKKCFLEDPDLCRFFNKIGCRVR